MGLLSDRTLLDFGMALSTAVLIADMIKSAYLSRSLVDVSPEKSCKICKILSILFKMPDAPYLACSLVG